MSDYIQDTLKMQIYYNSLFNQMTIEETYSNTVMESFIVMENLKDKVSSFFSNIIKMLESILNKFLVNLAEITKVNEKWINDNKERIKNINYDSIEIKAIPFWQFNFEKMKTELKSMTNLLKKSPDKNIINAKDMRQAIIDKHFSKYKSGDLPIAECFKNYFKVGSPDPKALEPKKVESGALKQLCINVMAPYVLDYHKTASPFLKNRVSEIKNELKIIDRRLKNSQKASNTTTKESYNEDIFSYMGDLQLLFEEAVKKVEVNVKNDNNAPLNKKETLDKKDKGQFVKSTTSNSSELTYYKNILQLIQLALASAMTAMEEKYRIYVSTLKQIVAATKQKGK